MSAKTSNNGFVFPLYLYGSAVGPQRRLLLEGELIGRRPNLAPRFINQLEVRLGLDFVDDGDGDLKRHSAQMTSSTTSTQSSARPDTARATWNSCAMTSPECRCQETANSSRRSSHKGRSWSGCISSSPNSPALQVSTTRSPERIPLRPATRVTSVEALLIRLPASRSTQAASTSPKTTNGRGNGANTSEG